MRLDRIRQKQILESLAACYPSYSTNFIKLEDEDNEIANLHYLREHGLVEASIDQTLAGAFIFSGARTTARGLDFLADDGGLSAILGTVTVKLHGDTIRELLLAKIEASVLQPEKKSWLKTQVNAMSGEALKAVTKSLVEQGLNHVPDFAQWAKSIFDAAS